MTKKVLISPQVRVRPYPLDTQYLVSDNGEIYSKAWGKLKRLSVFFTKCGYPRVKLRNKAVSIHRLVAETFVENTDNLETVDHIDFNKCNNHYTNLQWLTREDNAARSGRGTYKLVDPNGVVHEFHGQAEFCRKNGLTQANVSKVITGERPHHLGWTAYKEVEND